MASYASYALFNIKIPIIILLYVYMYYFFYFYDLKKYQIFKYTVPIKYTNYKYLML